MTDSNLYARYIMKDKKHLSKKKRESSTIREREIYLSNEYNKFRLEKRNIQLLKTQIQTT